MYIYRTGKGTAIEDQAFTCDVLLTDRGNAWSQEVAWKGLLKAQHRNSDHGSRRRGHKYCFQRGMSLPYMTGPKLQTVQSVPCRLSNTCCQTVRCKLRPHALRGTTKWWGTSVPLWLWETPPQVTTTEVKSCGTLSSRQQAALYLFIHSPSQQDTASDLVSQLYSADHPAHFFWLPDNLEWHNDRCHLVLVF